MLRTVFDAVLALEEPYQELVLLRYYEGLSTAEIAARTRVPMGTVRGRLQRALELLRQRLNHTYGGDRSRGWRVLLAFNEAAHHRHAARWNLSSNLTRVLVMGTTTKLSLSVAAVVLIATFLWQQLIPISMDRPGLDVTLPEASTVGEEATVAEESGRRSVATEPPQEANARTETPGKDGSRPWEEAKDAIRGMVTGLDVYERKELLDKALAWPQEVLDSNELDYQSPILNPERKVLGPVDLEALGLVIKEHNARLSEMGEHVADMVADALLDYFDNGEFERFRDGEEIPYRDVVRGTRHFDRNSVVGLWGWKVRTRFSTEDYPLLEEYFGKIDEAQNLRTEAVKAYIAALR